MKVFSRHFWLESVSREKLPGNAMSLATLLYLKANKEGITWVSNDVIPHSFSLVEVHPLTRQKHPFCQRPDQGAKIPYEIRPAPAGPCCRKRNQPVAEKATKLMSQLWKEATVPVAEKRNNEQLRKSATALYKEEPSKNHPGTIHHTGSTKSSAEKEPDAPSKNPANGCGVSRDSMDQVLGIFNRQRLKRFALPPLEMSGTVKTAAENSQDASPRGGAAGGRGLLQLGCRTLPSSAQLLCPFQIRGETPERPRPAERQTPRTRASPHPQP